MAKDDIEARQFAQRLFDRFDVRALAEARTRGVRERAAGPSAMLPKPAINGESLLNNKFRSGAWSGLNPPNIERPEGPLARHVGRRFTESELAGEFDSSETVACIVAWTLPALIGRVLVARDVDHIDDALLAMLVETFGELSFGFSGRGSYGGLGKYFHLHTSVTAPPMGREPMAIEIYGKLIAAGNLTFNTLEAWRMLLARERNLRELNHQESQRELDPEARRRLEDLIHGRDLPTPLYVQICAATYANVYYPGANVPLYM